jgi:hypothetical protein
MITLRAIVGVWSGVERRRGRRGGRGPEVRLGRGAGGGGKEEEVGNLEEGTRVW